MSNEVKLYPCEPEFWKFLTKTQRYVLGWITIELFIFSFFALPFCFVFLIPTTWRVAPITSSIFVSFVALSLLTPKSEW